MTLSDIQADGDWKLIVADLGTGTYDMKLKVYKSNLYSFFIIIQFFNYKITQLFCFNI